MFPVPVNSPCDLDLCFFLSNMGTQLSCSGAWLQLTKSSLGEKSTMPMLEMGWLMSRGRLRPTHGHTHSHLGRDLKLTSWSPVLSQWEDSGYRCDN